jgi:uncharacterized protein YecE (DUF72 family)
VAASLFIGCAGWNIPRQEQARFPAGGSHLERYAARLPAVEINSSFYRPHRPATYARWAETAPPGFRFAVKAPRTITHEAKLAPAAGLLDAFLTEVSGLGDQLGILLVQLPPSLRFERATAESFFAALRERYAGAVACEPRHPSWFGPEAEALLRAMRIARVAADPAPVPAAPLPGGWEGVSYHRLHGSPKMYYSAYSETFLKRLAGELAERAASGVETWCIFDNTAAGFAMPNALSLLDCLQRASTC